MARKVKRHDEVVGVFSIRLEETRRVRGFTQADLAEKAGVSVTYISQLERGETAPGIDLVGRLAGALGMTVAELLPAETSPATLEVLRSQAQQLFDRLLTAGGRETYLVLNPLLSLLVESANKRD
jgi:transcriptional regulator with XRE-family HTH domain